MSQGCMALFVSVASTALRPFWLCLACGVVVVVEEDGAAIGAVVVVVVVNEDEYCASRPS